jgi:diguanylate cyclase (GGDEF)-like protein/PAS domain S-box-containing protein
MYMVRSRFPRDAPAAALLGAVYFVAGKLGLKLAMVHASATAVWPCTGIALAAFLILGYRIWPGIWLGAFVLNLTTAGSAATSVAIATGNTLEGVLGAYLVNRYARGRNAFHRAQDTFKFAFFAGMLSTAISASFGVTALWLGGFANLRDYGPIWSTWWLGDAASAVVATPLLILWISEHHVRWNWVRFSEFAALMCGVFLVGRIVFDGLLFATVTHYPLEYLGVPFLIWTAFRFGGRETASAICILSGVAIWGTLHGHGPFVTSSPNDSLLMLQLFMAIFAVMGLVLAAAVAERKRVAERFGIAVESAPNAMVLVDRQGRIALVNSQAVIMFGYGREELNGQPVEMLIPERFRGGHPGHRMTFSSSPRARPMGAGRELYAVRKDGSEFPVEIGLNPIETEDGLQVMSAIVDITERKRAEEQIRHLALADPLTGLANYRRLLDALDSEIKRYGRSARSFAVLLLDLDGLKMINDAHGHLLGSRALCRVANVLRTHCREIDIAARYGGDEFVVVLPETEFEAAQHVAQRISEGLKDDGEEPPVSVSVGTAIFPQDGQTIEELLTAADRALYREKRSPKRPQSTRSISPLDNKR